MKVRINTLKLLFLLTLLPSLAAAQEPLEPPEAAYPYRRDIEKHKFDRAEQKLFKHLRRDTNNLELNYAAYRLFYISNYNWSDTLIFCSILCTD